MALCDRYDWRCLACGEHAPASDWLTRDHVVPVCKGGTDDIGNLQPLYRPCNEAKGRRVIDYRADWAPEKEAADD